jgi:hypothetical protein
MRRLILAPALALLVLAPSSVQAAADDLLVCDPPPAGTTVVGPNASLTPAAASPAFSPTSNTVTDLSFQLDLYPATATNKATINSTLNWQLAANDWDLILINDGTGDEVLSDGFQPLDPPTENVGGTMLHCSLFTVRILNFNAVQADLVDPLQLSVATGSMK